MTDTILEVHQVSKSFGSLSAVADVSFTVARGQIFGIAGPNGAGKTTLFNVISGLPFPPDSGRIVFQGVSVHGRAPSAIFHYGLARTFQRETVFASLSVLENVTLAARFGLRRGGRGSLRDKSLETLARVGLAEKANHVAGLLSIFEKKRLMLASALVGNPALLMLDEPAALNRSEIGYFSELFESLKAGGMTLLLIEHVLPLLLTLSDCLMVLDHGRKLTEGLPEDVMKDPAVVEAYLGKGTRHAG